MIGVNVDVTEHKMAEEALRRVNSGYGWRRRQEDVRV